MGSPAFRPKLCGCGHNGSCNFADLRYNESIKEALRLEYGFIRDMMDVKVLILYVAARCEYPLDQEQMYALCFQDDCVSYFDICTAIVQLQKSGHLTEVEKGKYVITEKGRQDGEITADSIAAVVRKKAAQAVEKYNKDTSRSSFRSTEVISNDDLFRLLHNCY